MAFIDNWFLGAYRPFRYVDIKRQSIIEKKLYQSGFFDECYAYLIASWVIDGRPLSREHSNLLKVVLDG